MYCTIVCLSNTIKNIYTLLLPNVTLSFIPRRQLIHPPILADTKICFFLVRLSSTTLYSILRLFFSIRSFVHQQPRKLWTYFLCFPLFPSTRFHYPHLSLSPYPSLYLSVYLPLSSSLQTPQALLDTHTCVVCIPAVYRCPFHHSPNFPVPEKRAPSLIASLLTYFPPIFVPKRKEKKKKMILNSKILSVDKMCMRL